MKTITIKSYKNFSRSLGEGDEGHVYSYKDKYAVKVFSIENWESYDFLTLERLDRKFEKIEAMMSLKHKNAAFPLGFANVPDENKAFYMPVVLPPEDKTRVDSLDDYNYNYYDENVEGILVKADETLQDLHKMGVVLGDIKRNNILIRNGKEPVFVDLDNAAFQGYTYDLLPNRAKCFNSIYGGNIDNQIDNDRLLFALMTLQLKTGDSRFWYLEGKDSIKNALNVLRTDKETKEILECIFSSAENKPYIGKVLSKIDKH